MPEEMRESIAKEAQRIAIESLGEMPDWTADYDPVPVFKRILLAHKNVRAFELENMSRWRDTYHDSYSIFDTHRIVASAWEATTWLGAPESVGGERLMLYVSACIAAEKANMADIDNDDIGSCYFDSGAEIALDTVERNEKSANRQE